MLDRAADVTATAPVGPPLLEARHLSKRFPLGGWLRPRVLHALEDASFVLERQRVLALVGESGSGKSTTARLIARLIAPSAGEIIFKGRDVLKAEPRGASLAYRGDVQMIFQDPFASLNPVHTVGYHLGRPLRIHHKAESAGTVRERIEALLAAVGLTPPAEFADKFPHELSGGQRQRVAFARALAVDPDVMLADEPISMLDVSIRMGILNLMERLKEERGIAYLYITHDIASARYIGDETIVMYAGHMVEGAGSDELIRHPAHPYTKLLLSAVPDPRATRERVAQTRGELPSLLDPGRGCPFAGRCPHTMAVCREAMPGAETVAPGHWVRCHLFGPGQAPTFPNGGPHPRTASSS
jgi:peptide/nickel transport system ATP-binding protein